MRACPATPGPVEIEVSGAFDKFVDPGVDVVHGRREGRELGDGFLLLLVRCGPVVSRPWDRGLPHRCVVGGVQDVGDVVDVQVAVCRESGLNLPGQDGDGVPAQRVDW